MLLLINVGGTTKKMGVGGVGNQEDIAVNQQVNNSFTPPRNRFLKLWFLILVFLIGKKNVSSI